MSRTSRRAIRSSYGSQRRVTCSSSVEAGDVFQTMPLGLRAARATRRGCLRGCGIREIGHEAGMVPERRSGHDEALEIGEDGGHRLAALGAAGGQSVGELAGLDGGQHGIALGMRQVIGDPIDCAMAVDAEFFRSHETSARAQRGTNLPGASRPVSASVPIRIGQPRDLLVRGRAPFAAVGLRLREE